MSFSVSKHYLSYLLCVKKASGEKKGTAALHSCGTLLYYGITHLHLSQDEVRLTTKVIDKENGGIEVSIYDMLNEFKAYKNLDV